MEEKNEKIQRLQRAMRAVSNYPDGSNIVNWMRAATDVIQELWDNSWCSVDPFEMPEERE